MFKFIEKTIGGTPVYYRLRSIWNTYKDKKYEEYWKENRDGQAPHRIKQQFLRKYALEGNLYTLVETGTFLGDMVHALRKDFRHIYSIELSNELYGRAKKRFKGLDQVEILQGDSGEVLPRIVNKIGDRVLFWLDGHYSSGVTAKGEKNTPIFKELDAIFNANIANYLIVIDDARCFGVEVDYPSLTELEDYVKIKNKKLKMKVIDDFIVFEMFNLS